MDDVQTKLSCWYWEIQGWDKGENSRKYCGGSDGSPAVFIPSNDRTNARVPKLKSEYLEKNFLEEWGS